MQLPRLRKTHSRKTNKQLKKGSQMFGLEFYPTPVEVIERMLEGFSPAGKIILEPSAGKGNIIDYLKNNHAADLLACELNDDLRKILATKCNVVSNDFFSLSSDKISHVQAIIMNPPFSCADRHILHAWEIAPAGCAIIALCNTETINNPYSNLRYQLKKTIEEYGNTEKLGACFADSERNTDVNITVVKLQKPGDNNSEFSGFFMDDDEPELQANAIMPFNEVRNLVNRYISAIKLFDQQIELGLQMNGLTRSFYTSKIAFTCTDEGKPKLRNDYKKDLQKSAWNYIFDKMNLRHNTTKGLREDINKFVEQQQTIPFTMRNIYHMLDIVIGTTGSRMDRALLEVFDKLTQHYDENRYGVEGWKTNSHYLLNEKFIMPWLTEVGWSGQLSLRLSGNYEIIEDFQKAICYITGTSYDNCISLYSFVNKKNLQFGELYTWGFFEFRAYKKGTMHFRFLDKELWGKFNQHISRIKGFPLYEYKKG
jgi:hypothetical protein